MYNIKSAHETLFRSPVPTSWEHIALIKESGISTIINLQGKRQYNCIYLGQEEKLLKDFGIKVVYIPMHMFKVPTFDQLEKVFQTLNTTSEKVLIHCRFGVDRTGISIAYWKIRNGLLSFEEAVLEMFSLGFHKKWFFWWVPQLKAYLNSLTQEAEEVSPSQGES